MFGLDGYLLAVIGVEAAIGIIFYVLWVSRGDTILELRRRCEDYEAEISGCNETIASLAAQRDVGLFLADDVDRLYSQASDAALAEHMPATDTSVGG